MRKTQTTGLACIGTALIVAFGCTFANNAGTTDSLENIGAAIAALFSGGEGGQASQTSPEEHTTCSEFESTQELENAQGISVTASVAAGTYGPSTQSVTVTADDDCESAPNDPNSFAGFEITQAVTATCQDGSSISLMPGSAGVWRNHEALGYYPQIWGTFNVEDSFGNSFTGIKCAIFLDEQETVIEATCEDSIGTPIDTDASTTTCQFDTD